MKSFGILAIAAASFIAGAILQRCPSAEDAADPEVNGCVVDTIRYIDTIPYYLPAAKGEIVTGKSVARLAVFIPDDSTSRGNLLSPIVLDKCGDDDSIAVDEIYLHEFGESPPIVQDSVTVEIPITQREYEGDGYHAWISGYEPKMDSIFVFPHYETVTIRMPSRSGKRWGLGFTAGYGYTPKGLQPYVGISLNYNLLNFIVCPMVNN